MGRAGQKNWDHTHPFPQKNPGQTLNPPLKACVTGVTCGHTVRNIANAPLYDRDPRWPNHPGIFLMRIFVIAACYWTGALWWAVW